MAAPGFPYFVASYSTIGIVIRYSGIPSLPPQSASSTLGSPHSIRRWKMFNTQIVETAPLTNWLSGGISYRFSRYSSLALMIGTLLLAGCATTGRPNTQANSSTNAVISDAQAGDAAPKVDEESSSSTTGCEVVGAIMGGAIGIVAVAVPICSNWVTAGACPEAVLLFGGGMAVIGAGVGKFVCRRQSNTY